MPRRVYCFLAEGEGALSSNNDEVCPTSSISERYVQRTDRSYVLEYSQIRLEELTDCSYSSIVQTGRYFPWKHWVKTVQASLVSGDLTAVFLPLTSPVGVPFPPLHAAIKRSIGVESYRPGSTILLPYLYYSKLLIYFPLG